MPLEAFLEWPGSDKPGRHSVIVADQFKVISDYSEQRHMVVALRCDEADRGGEVFVLPREACGKSICELPTNLLKGHKRAAVGPGGETSLLIVPDPVSRQAAKLVLRHVMPG